MPLLTIIKIPSADTSVLSSMTLVINETCHQCQVRNGHLAHARSYFTISKVCTVHQLSFTDFEEYSTGLVAREVLKNDKAHIVINDYDMIEKLSNFSIFSSPAFRVSSRREGGFPPKAPLEFSKMLAEDTRKCWRAA